MGIYTYINDSDRERWSKVEDKELNDLFQEVRKLDKRFLLSCNDILVKRSWFRKPIIKKVYCLYIDMGGDAKCVNFAQEHLWSINTDVAKSYIMTYFFGYITGRRYYPQ